MWSNAKLARRENVTRTDGKMVFLHLIFCCLTVYTISEGKIVQAIIGRNVSFSWTFKNIKNDIIYILHDDSNFYEVSEPKNLFDPLTLPDRVRILVNDTTRDHVMVTVNFLNITDNDAGMYRVVRNYNSQDLDESVHLKTIDETMIPKIAIARHTMLNSTLVFECRLSNSSTGEFFWSVNESMIGNHGRYYQNNTFLSISNLTIDEQYNLYKCNEPGSGLESDPYRVQIYGPNAIKFAPNITMVQEHSGLNLSCLADCHPICSWKWSKSDLFLQEDKIISTEKTLHVQNITRQDAGTYSCRVRNNITGISLENFTSIHIVYGPNAIKFAPNITMVQEHSGLNLSCLADCHPICSWKWSKSDLFLQEDKIISTEKTLHVQNITRQDAGTYSCRVRNNITGISLENFTSIHIVYGPDILSFNSSDRIIHLNEKDSKTISCSADCFPPCQIGWTETNADIRIPDAELKLVSVNRNSNYTCHATNARKNNATISDTIYVIVQSGISQYITRAMTSEEETEEFPSKSHLLYVLLGIGILLPVAVLICLLRKNRTCSRVNRLSNSKSDDGEVSLQDEIPSGNYWTIVSNADGELNSAIETDFERRREQLLIGQNIISTQNNSKQLMGTDNIKVNEELDGYLNPVQSRPIQLDDYIHPIHHHAIGTDFERRREQLLTGQNIVSTHNDSKQLVGPDDVKANEELDGYLNPVHSRPVQLDDYIHPVHSHAIDFERRREQLLTGQNIVSTHNDSKQLVGPDDVKVNEELDGYLNPVHSRPVQLDDYIHPVHSHAIDFERRREHLLIGQNIVSTRNESKQLVGPDDVKVNEELDGYLNPVHSTPVQQNNYIHPVHLDAIERDFEERRKQLLIGQNIVSAHNDPKQLVGSDEANVNDELEEYFNPGYSCSDQLDDYIHPVHSDPGNTGFVSTRYSTEF